MSNAFRNLVDHYERCFGEHGNTAKGFDWPSEDYATRTYRVMSDLVTYGRTLRGHRGAASLLDVGCGTGRLRQYCLDHGIDVQYRGIDLSAMFVARAQTDFPDALFEVCDVLSDADLAKLPEQDFIVCNGIFTQKLAMPNDEMRTHFETFLKRLWTKCRVGLAFNSTSEDAVDWKKDNLFYLGFSDTARFLKTNLSSQYLFRQDYGLYEFTAYVFK